MPDSPTPDGVVLVVDDTADSLRFLSDTIERAGMTVLVATSGKNALELLEHIAPDLILMDAVMPAPDGFETTRRIKQNPAWAHIPVIFMTGLTEAEHAVKALECGGVDYVRKPIVIEELLARIRVHFHNARVAHASRRALDATGRYLFSTDQTGRIIWSTPQAERVFAELSPGWDSTNGTVPELLRQPLVRLITSDNRSGALAKVDAQDMTIEMSLIDNAHTDENLVRLNVIREGADIALLQKWHGLTLRESEVLLWVSYGKPNRVISEILGISPRTVNKHLEQIFEKLGVETRAAAAAFAVRTIAR